MKQLILGLLIISMFLVVACGKSSERQEILNFINDSNNSAVMERATAVNDDWNAITGADIQTYTRSKLIYELGLIEQRAGVSYREMSEVVSPKCLRGYWDKEVEASKLYYQAISLTYRLKDDPNISQDQVNDLVFRANDLKTAALREFEDICDENDIEIPW